MEKIRAHLLETVAETYRRDLAEAEQAADWKQRQRLRDAAEAANAIRLGRIDELAASFAEIEGRSAANPVFQDQAQQKHWQGALANAEASIKIDERLSQLDLSNATWQADVKASRAWLGQLRQK